MKVHATLLFKSTQGPNLVTSYEVEAIVKDQYSKCFKKKVENGFFVEIGVD